MEAESIALAWRLQQEEQQAFLGAMEASTPNPPSRHGAGGTGVGGSGGSASTGGAEEGMEMEDDDASLQVGCHATHTRPTSRAHPLGGPRVRRSSLFDSSARSCAGSSCRASAPSRRSPEARELLLWQPSVAEIL